MSLVFAGLVPHPPLLLPSIGRENSGKLKKTQAALSVLEENLYLSKPDALVILTGHGNLLSDAFSINFCTEFITDLRKFGDLTTNRSFVGDLDLAHLIRAAAKKQNYGAVLISEPALDHGTSIPLLFLTTHLPSLSILPIATAELDFKTHLEFGTLIKDQIMKTNKRVAVLASADLSHALTSQSPAGFAPEGAVFDQTIQELLSNHNTAGILNLDPQLVARSATCGFRPILVLLGVLREVNFTFESLAYEAPFGVGYLTAQCAL